VRVLDRERVVLRSKIPADQAQAEKQHYNQAVQLVSDHLLEHIQEDHSDSSLSASMILKSHQAILTDEQFHDAVRARIVAELKNAAWALELEARKIITQLEASRSPYLASRAEDVKDLVSSIVHALSPAPKPYKKALVEKKESQVLISGNLYPSWAIEARRFRSVAFATESNALSSHAAILLKGFGIPTVGGVNGLREHVADRRHVFTTAGRRVVIRTFDIGNDKRIAGLNYCTGQNPALGVRGVRRHLLWHPEELRIQFRAILRAAVGCQVDILLPMVTTVDDVRQVKKILKDVTEELRKEDTPFSDDVRLGAMIEVPAAAIGIGEILAEVDFVNIGTNDLLQYFVAADRDNEAVLRYENFEDTAFLWLLRFVMERATELGKKDKVTICGEIASNPQLVPLLLALGFRSLSITPTAAQSVRDAIASIDLRPSAST